MWHTVIMNGREAHIFGRVEKVLSEIEVVNFQLALGAAVDPNRKYALVRYWYQGVEYRGLWPAPAET